MSPRCGRHILALVLAFGLCGAGRAAALEITFQPQAVVDGGVILLGDIASVGPDGPAARRLAVLPIRVHLPAPGKSVTLTAADIWTVLSRQQPELAGASRTGADRIVVTRKGTVFGATEMLAALEGWLGSKKDSYPQSSLRLENPQLPPAFSLPPGRLDVEVLPASTNLPQNSRFTIICRVNGKVEKNFTVAARVAILTPVVTATRDIPRADVLAAGDLAITTQDIGLLHGDPLLDAREATGQEARRAIRRGQVLFAAMLAPAVVVKRGEMVAINAKSGAMSAVAQGEAMEDGARGQTITVRNQTSKKKLSATVVGPGSVEVRF